MESTYVEITTKAGKKLIVGSLYRSPNKDEAALTTHISETVNKVDTEKEKKQLILEMDHDLDLLKSHLYQLTRKFLDMVTDHNLLPTITRPTRKTNQSMILIDDLLISNQPQCCFDSMLLLEDISDHLPSLITLKQCKITDKNPLEYQSRKLNNNKLTQIKQNLLNIDWNGHLNSEDCKLISINSSISSTLK